MRIATAGLGNPASVIVVTGTGFADALAAGPAATGDILSSQGKPAAIVLSDGPKITDAAHEVVRPSPARPWPTGEEFGHVLALGGQAVCAVQIIDARSDSPDCFHFLPGMSAAAPPIGIFSTLTGDKSFEGADGGDRYETAAAVANLSEHSLPGPDGIRDNGVNFGFFGLASGTTYADALTGGAAMAVEHAPIVLTTRASFPPATAWVIAGRADPTEAPTQMPTTFTADVFGGPAAVAPALQAALTAKINP